jgi:hypothetical protein
LRGDSFVTLNQSLFPSKTLSLLFRVCEYSSVHSVDFIRSLKSIDVRLKAFHVIVKKIRLPLIHKKLEMWLSVSHICRLKSY